MQIIILIILTILLLATLIAIIFLYKKLQESTKPKEGEGNEFVMLQNQMQELQRVFDQKMNESSKDMAETRENLHQTIQRQFGQSTRVITEITEKLTSLDKTNQQVIGFSEQLNNLQKILTHQKQRGELGEAGLKLVLENMLSPQDYELQHRFDDGDIVDAVIKTKEGLVPVDAKFSLDNYNRIREAIDDTQKEALEKEFKHDLKKRIDETSKYIKPKEGTLEFAFMYIPAEAIYYDLLVNEVGTVKVNTRNLVEYAFRDKHVIIVSPTTFSAYLKTVLMGLQALEIEQGAKEIRKNVEQLGKHLNAYESFMQKLGVSMGTTVNHFNTAYKELGKIDKDVVRITEGERAIEPMQLDQPKTQDELL